MHKIDSLPIVLVSASDSICASKIVSELIDDTSIPEDNRISEESRIWRIVNKYYRADVKLQPLVDGQPPPLHLAALVEAHLIYLRSDESEECAERRLVEAGVLSHESHVRLAVAEGPESGALAAWASRRRYELIARSESAGADGEESGEDEDEARGLDRVRAALHAHTWRGLVRLDRPDAPPPQPIPDDAPLSDTDAESGDSWGSWEAWRGEVGAEQEARRGEVEAGQEVRRGEVGAGQEARRGVVGAGQEAFGALLGSLRAERGALGPLPDAQRRRRAELLLAAFRDALAPDDIP